MTPYCPIRLFQVHDIGHIYSLIDYRVIRPRLIKFACAIEAVGSLVLSPCKAASKLSTLSGNSQII